MRRPPPQPRRRRARAGAWGRRSPSPRRTAHRTAPGTVQVVAALQVEVVLLLSGRASLSFFSPSFCLCATVSFGSVVRGEQSEQVGEENKDELVDTKK